MARRWALGRRSRASPGAFCRTYCCSHRAPLTAICDSHLIESSWIRQSSPNHGSTNKEHQPR
eukprot:6371711-Prymnesium_polylepis.2